MSFKLQYLERVPRVGNGFSDYGTFCHSLIERWARGKIPDFALAEVYEREYDGAVVHDFPPFPVDMPWRYYEAGLSYFEDFQGFGPREILAVEERFELAVSGYPFIGIVDLVLRDKADGKIAVVDHKSAGGTRMKKELSAYRRQLYVYAAYVREKFGVFPDKLCFNLFRERTMLEMPFERRAFDETMAWAAGLIESILLTDAFPATPPSPFFCRFLCSVCDSCPAQAAALEARDQANMEGASS